MTSRPALSARVTAARIALRIAARGVAAGDLPAASLTTAVVDALNAHEAEWRAEAPTRSRRAIAEAKSLVRKSKLARHLCGTGDLWNGSDRAHQFALLNEAARLRRATTLYLY